MTSTLKGGGGLKNTPLTAFWREEQGSNSRSLVKKLQHAAFLGGQRIILRVILGTPTITSLFFSIKDEESWRESAKTCSKWNQT